MKKKNSGMLLILAVLGILMISSIAQAQSTRYTRTFVYNASISNLFEIKSSQLALERSNNPAVKEFALRMINDHKKAYDELKTFSAPDNDTSSHVMFDVDADHQAILDKLAALNDKEFDALYVQAQAEAHEKAVKLFTDYTEDGYDATIRTYANQTLPVLVQHDQHLEMLRSSI